MHMTHMTATTRTVGCTIAKRRFSAAQNDAVNWRYCATKLPFLFKGNSAESCKGHSEDVLLQRERLKRVRAEFLNWDQIDIASHGVVHEELLRPTSLTKTIVEKSKPVQRCNVFESCPFQARPYGSRL